MHKAELGDLVRIQYSRLRKHGAATAKPRAPKELEFTVGSGDIVPGVSLGVVGMAPGDRKRLAFPSQAANSTVPGDLIKQKPPKRSPTHLDLGVGKRRSTVIAATGRPGRLMAAETRLDPVVVELEITLVTLDSSSNANKRKPQFELGGEA